jgi:hypothetical protein
MVNNVYERSFSYKIHIIQNACNLRYKDAYTSCYKCHAKCKKYIKGSYTYATKELSHTLLKKSNTHQAPFRKRVKVAWSRGLGKISASWSCVGTWIKVIFPFSTLSLRKWYLTSMCLVFEWSTVFFTTLMALVLSHWSGTWVYSSPKSLMVYVTKRSREQQLAAATYYASVVDWATLDCWREDQNTKEDPKNWQVLEVDFLSNRHPAKSASEKPWSSKEEDAEYQRPKSGVWRKYLKIHFTACRCEVLAWKRVHRHTENWMSGLVAVK